MLIKRLLALEGDWVTVPGRMEVEKIPKVCKPEELHPWSFLAINVKPKLAWPRSSDRLLC